MVKELLAFTLGHCAYCDGFPLGETSRETIDHFRPKGDDRFLHLAFEWSNLFPCCDVCQEQKQESFSEALLKPDEQTYDFDAFFDFNVKTGSLEPNRRASEADQERARSTIETFGLNIAPRRASRLRFFERHYRGPGLAAAEVDELPYRYLGSGALVPTLRTGG